MRPFAIPLGITLSPARLLAGLLLMAAVVAATVAWWRRRARDEQAAADAPLQRLRGFHIFGPDEDEDDVRVHIPLLGRRVDSELRVPPPPSAAARGAAPAATNGSAPATEPGNPAAATKPAAAATNGTAPTAAAQPATPAAAKTPPAQLDTSAAPVLASAAARLASAQAGASAAAARLASAQGSAPPPAASTAAPARPPAASAAPAAPPKPTTPPAPQAPATRTIVAPAAPTRATNGTAPAKPARRSDNGTAAPPRSRNAPPTKPDADFLDRDILLVEDDDTIATMYLMLLGARGYATRHARDGVEGIAAVRKEKPALILLDMMMPRMDGLQFLEALRGWPKSSNIPVVVLSNVADHSLVERALALGAVEYLIKAQTRPQVLVGALPHWLRGNRALTT